MLPMLQNLFCNSAPPLCVHGAINLEHGAQFHHTPCPSFFSDDGTLTINSSVTRTSWTSRSFQVQLQRMLEEGPPDVQNNYPDSPNEQEKGGATDEYRKCLKG